MSLIDHEKLRAAPVMVEPFQYLIAPGLVGGRELQSVMRDFPKMERPGSVPLAALEYGPAFNELVENLRGPEVAEMLSEKFEVDLRGRPTMMTVRGKCRARDGKIHIDSKDKIVTVLLYLNPSWEREGGRLRLLSQSNDIEDYVVEVPPDEGTLLRSNVRIPPGMGTNLSKVNAAPSSSTGSPRSAMCVASNGGIKFRLSSNELVSRPDTRGNQATYGLIDRNI
jgi:SM-20-related protein